MPVTDLNGLPLGGIYPQGHVSVYWQGQSKTYIEKLLQGLVGPGQPVLP